MDNIKDKNINIYCGCYRNTIIKQQSTIKIILYFK
nr:MAG TPA: hypothetical protein [Caudoviricetes sp.]